MLTFYYKISTYCIVILMFTALKYKTVFLNEPVQNELKNKICEKTTYICI